MLKTAKYFKYTFTVEFLEVPFKYTKDSFPLILKIMTTENNF